MLKGYLALMALVVISTSYSTQAAETDVEKFMDVIASNYRTALKTSSQQEFQQALDSMKAAALDAQKGTPEKLKHEPADSANMQDYRHGLDILISQIEAAKQVADSGNFKQAQQDINALKKTRDNYHRKYKQ